MSVLKVFNKEIELSELAELCKKLDLALVVLFGSQATGDSNYNSDIDVGVLSNKRELTEDYQEEVWQSFLWFFGSGAVDVIFLNRAFPLLAFRAAVTGKVLYEARQGTFRDFVLLAAKRHADAKKLYDLKKEYVRRFIQDTDNGR